MMQGSSTYNEIVKTLLTKNSDIASRRIPFKGGELTILYIKELTERSSLSEFVIKPLVLYCGSVDKSLRAHQCETVIFADALATESDWNSIENNILNGMVVILFSNDENYLVINQKKVANRGVTPPEFTYTLRGPRDCFSESMDVNLSLLRYRMKDTNFRIDSFTVGKRTKTRVSVAYIADIANDTSVNEIKKRIKKIDVDGIIESGELQMLLLNKQRNLFPQMGLSERSDMACGAMLEGKVIVLVDGSALALIGPKTMGEFLQTGDDNYDNKYLGLFLKTLRYIALMLSFTLSALYVAIVGFHSDIMPADYIIAVAQMRSEVPFNVVTGVLLIEFILEILRESLVRIPKQIGPAVGIVGAIIIGQSAIAAGIFSPVALIFGSLALICSFVIPDFTLINPFRLIKLFMIFITAIFGIYGFSLGILFIAANLVSINSFGVPYMAPMAPYNGYDFSRSFLYGKKIAPKRPNFLRTKNKYRTNPNKTSD